MSYETPEVVVFDGPNDHVFKIKASNHLWAIAANPEAKKVYAVSVGGANVTIIDDKLHPITLPDAGEIPCAIAVDYSSGKLFVANYGSNNVTVIEGTTDSVAATVSVGPNPQAIAVDSSNHKVYVASTREGAITVLDGTNHAVLGTVKTVKAPYAIAVNDKSHKAVALGLDGDLTVIDGMTLATSSPFSPISDH